MWKSRVLFVLAVLGSGILSLTYPDARIGFTLLYALLIMFVFSLLSLFFSKRFIAVEQKIENHTIRKGDRLLYSVKLSNNSPFIYPHVGLDYVNTELLSSIGGWLPETGLSSFKSFRSKSQITFPYRGVYQVGISAISLTDFLGLFVFNIPVEGKSMVTVLPSFDPEFTLSQLYEKSRLSRQQDFLHQDQSLVADVRSYGQGDDMRKIHWKLSAKKGDLLIKNFESLEPQKVAIFIDTKLFPLTGLDRTATEDRFITHVAGALTTALNNRLSVELVGGSTSSPMSFVRHDRELPQGFRWLAELDFKPEASETGSVSQLTGLNATLLFLWNLNPVVAAEIHYLASYEYNPVIYYAYADSFPLTPEKQLLLQELEQRGIPVDRMNLSK